MFFSLNKKILYSLLAFLLLIIGIFLAIFINFYAQNLQDNQNSVYIRNQYVVSLLYDNIQLQKTLVALADKYPSLEKYVNKNKILSQNLSSTEKELTREQQLNAELQKNYDKNREALKTGIEIIGISALVVIMLIFLLLFLLDYWVITPIEKMTHISQQVSKGVLSKRLDEKQKSFLHDEFDILFTTFNQMLDSMEQNLEKIKMREKFLQQLIDAVPDAIRVLDKEHNVIMENMAFKKLLQVKGTCVGRKCFEAYGFEGAPCSRSRYNCPIAHLQDQKEKTFHAIHEINSIPIHINAARLFTGDKHKDEYYIVEAMHDLRSDVMFSHQQKLSSLSFISTSIAHEIKNNLGAIRIILEGLLDDFDNNISKDKLKQYLSMIHKQLVETVKTPERLLKMSQYMDAEIVEIDVKNAVIDVIQMTDYSAKRSGIEVNISIADNLLIAGNEADFKMILLNLVQNAIKAMPEGGKLTLSGNKKYHKAIINITDNGIGISAEKIKHIFEPFYSANDKVHSSGLGLAIVNSLVNKFKGSINVESTEGKGTTFTLEIPLCKRKK